MGFALPVDQLVFMLDRMKYWGEQFGLKFLGQVDTTSDNPTGFGPAASAILTKYPSVQIIVTFNDESAIAAATTVAISGKKVFVATPNAAEAGHRPGAGGAPARPDLPCAVGTAGRAERDCRL